VDIGQPIRTDPLHINNIFRRPRGEVDSAIVADRIPHVIALTVVILLSTDAIYFALYLI